MQEITNFAQLNEKIAQETAMLLYVSTPNCGVCAADFPRVSKIVAELQFPSYRLDASKVPEAVGQLELFSAPTVILFYEGKEFHRQGRFLDFKELTHRITQVQTAV